MFIVRICRINHITQITLRNFRNANIAIKNRINNFDKIKGPKGYSLYFLATPPTESKSAKADSHHEDIILILNLSKL